MTQEAGRRRARALYRAGHRGTKEMDILLGRFAQARIGAMSESEFANFERLLDLADPSLQQWIFAPGEPGNAEFAGLIGEIRHFHGLASGAGDSV